MSTHIVCFHGEIRKNIYKLVTVLILLIFSFSTAVTLKIRSRSPKSNQFFVMSQLYIFMKIH